MRIDWVIPARYVEVHDNLATIVGAGIDRYTTDQADLPPVQLLLAMRLVGTADEFGPQPHAVRNVVRAPDGQTVFEVEGELVAEGQNLESEWLNALTLPVAIQFQPSEPGTYTVEVQVDDDTKAFPIHVVLAG